MNDSEKELREATVEARDYHPNVGVFELTANGAFEILGELDRLRALVAALDTAAEKKKHGHAGALRELENTRSRLSLAEKRIAELEGEREKVAGRAAPGFSEARTALEHAAKMSDAYRDALPVIAELDRRAHVIAAQAAELERLRAFRANAQQVADDIGCEGWGSKGKCPCPGCRIRRADWDDSLDRASPAQAEPQADRKLRDSLTETVCRMVSDGTRVYIAGLAEQIVDVVLAEIDRASHAQSDPQPGATPCAK